MSKELKAMKSLDALTPSSSFHSMKFRVSSPEQSERLQKVLFSLGSGWPEKEPKYCDRPFIYVEPDEPLCHGTWENVFSNATHEEMDTEQFISDNSPATSEQPTIETNVIPLVNVLGKLYNKSDVENALSMLTQYKLEDV